MRNKKIILKDKLINYKVRKSNTARRMRLAVYTNGSIIVTAPQDLQFGRIENYIKDKADWLFKKIAFFEGLRSKFTLGHHNDYTKYRDSAFFVIKKRVDYFSKKFVFEYNKIVIKNRKTCWGSCSSNGNLNFNYKMLFLPNDIRDYIVVHELCHLKEFNHSKKFWALVKSILPEYENIKIDLKQMGLNYN